VEEGIRGHGLKITILPHARQRMREWGITEAQVRPVLERPAHQYPGNYGRMVAEKREGDGRLAIKVVYNAYPGNERIVVTVMSGRPRR
jgi:Domain of unknown function (DUF4258)